MSKSVITFSSFPVFIGWLCALCKLALCVMPAVLNLIFDCPGLELAMAVHGGLPTKWPLFCVLCIPCVPVCSGDVA